MPPNVVDALSPPAVSTPLPNAMVPTPAIDPTVCAKLLIKGATRGDGDIRPASNAVSPSQLQRPRADYSRPGISVDAAQRSHFRANLSSTHPYPADDACIGGRGVVPTHAECPNSQRNVPSRSSTTRQRANRFIRPIQGERNTRRIRQRNGRDVSNHTARQAQRPSIDGSGAGVSVSARECGGAGPTLENHRSPISHPRKWWTHCYLQQ